MRRISTLSLSVARLGLRLLGVTLLVLSLALGSFSPLLVTAPTAHAATPPTTGLIARYVAGTGISSSGGSPDLITQWNDQSGNGYDLTQGTSSAEPYNGVDSAGNPVVHFPFSYPTAQKRFLSNASIALNDRNSSIFVIRSNHGSVSESLVSYSSWASVLKTTAAPNGTQPSLYLGLAGRNYTDISPPLNKTLTGGVLGSVNYIGYSIDASSTQSSISNLDTTGIRIGSDNLGTGNFFSGDIYEVLIYNTAVSQATVDAIRSYAISQYGIQSSFTKQVVMVGDSNTDGSGASLDENYPRHAYPSDWKAFNNGHGGSTLSGSWIGQSFATSTDLLYNSTLAKNVAVVMLGTNDINSLGHTAAQTFADLDHFIGDRQAAGWEVWVMTIPPVGGTGSGPETTREAYNTLLTNTANYTHIPSKIIDYRSDARIGGTATQASYSNGDALHYNANGAAVLAEYVYKALNSNVGPVSYSVSGNASGAVNQAVTLTLAATGGNFLGETITPSDGGAGGTFTPTSRTTTISSTSTTFTYSRPTGGTSSITFANDGILNNPSAFSFTADATAPMVTLTAPADGSTASSTAVTLTASASDNIAVAGVQFKLDTNTAVGSEDISPPYSTTWDSTGVSDGPHTLIAVARDAAGNYATSTTVHVTVDNTAPVRSVGSPSGALALNTTSTSISLSTDEAATCKYSTSSGVSYDSMTPFTTTGNTSHSSPISGLSNGGSYVYYVKCRDGQGNINATDYGISFTVPADSSSPSVSLGTPLDNTTVSGAVALFATASDDVSVFGVQFKLDNTTNLGAEDITSPYTGTWDSTSVPDGPHALIAVARDTSNNYATSSAATVIVDNTAPTITDNGSSSGTLPSGTTAASIAVSTDENAQCKYDTTANTAFGSMANTFTTTGTTTPTTSHLTTVTGLSNGTSYTYYVRCQDAVGNATTTDLAISFSVASPSSSSSGGGGGGGGWTPPPPTAPAGGFVATASASATAGKQTLHFTFGSDVTKIVLSDNTAFVPASYIDATSTLDWPNSDTGTWYVKFCNVYTKCSNPLAVSPPVATTQPATSTYSYARNLTLCDSGADVAALQQFLIAGGYTISAGATGYFGSQTQAALAAYQKVHNINPPAGYFGSLTRASIAGNRTAPATDTTAAPSPSFARPLKQGDTDPDVLSLQQFLNTHGFTVAASGLGSPGHETNYFGPATYQAVLKFQAAYAEQILTPVGLANPTGYVGSSTLAEIEFLSGN